MQERELFLSALEIEDPAARKSHLESACAGDAEMLARVESLLSSHEAKSQFLNTPAVEQMADEAVRGFDATILVGDDGTQDDEAGDASDDEIPLGYLQPSSKPDSLGRLGHYEILEVIGRGAFGTVLRAFDEKLQRVVAIKVLAPEMAATSPARKRFLREARTSAQVRHENVVAIYAVEDQPIPYLVMEYIPGKTLQERLDEQGPLDLADVLRLGKQIADGLTAAHAEDLIHRDVKPGNILLEGGLDDRVKITDFGLARTADDASMTQSGVIAGTPLYMAPEQAFGKKLDQRADLFSFGSVLYQMVSGRPPFRAPSTMAVLKRVTEDTPRPIQEVIPETPEWMCQLIGHLHAKDPDERYGTAKEVSKLLARCLTDLEAGRTPTIPPPGHVTERASQANEAEIVPRATLPFWKRPIAQVAAVLILLLGGVLLIATQYWGSDNVVNDIPEEDTPVKLSKISELPPNSIAYKLSSDEYKWTEPEQVVIGDDPQMTITNPCLSSEGQTLYFASFSYPAVVGKEGIFFSQRSPDGQSWEAAEAFPAPINSRAQEGGPCVSADGKTLLFQSARRGGEGNKDLWMATRASVDEPFGEVENMGDTVNNEKWQVDPDLSADGLTLLFVSNPDGNADVWMCQRETIGDPFGSPRNLGPAINSPQAEFAPALSQDGTALLFTSNRNGQIRLWMSLRASDKESFGEARLLDIEKGDFGVAHPFLAVDGSELVLYFILWKDESTTLWRTRRVPKGAADDQQSVPSVRREPITWPSDAPPLAIAPYNEDQAKQHQQAWADYLGLPVEKQVLLGGKDKDGLDIKLTLVLIPPGEFMIGSSKEEIAKFREQSQANGIPFRELKWIELEGPERSVRISRPFYMSNTEITTNQFRSFVDMTGFETEAERSGEGSWTIKDGRMVLDPTINWRNPRGVAPTSPVTHVTWDDANVYCHWISKQDTELTFALPTEAQWEYACRAGTTTAWSCGDDEAELADYAIVNMNWYRWCGSKKPNAFGLYDMHGNVWEWCRDSIYNYRDAETVDPVGPNENKKIIRGGNAFGKHGGWHNSNGCRSAVRYEVGANHRVLDKGFRVIAKISEELLRSKASPGLRTYSSDEWIDVIPLIYPQLDKLDGPLTGKNQWRVEGGELLVGEADSKSHKLLFPLDAEWPAFEFDVEFTRSAGESGFCLNLPTPKGDCPIVLDWRNKPGVVIGTVGKGKRLTSDAAIETGKRTSLRVEVRKQDNDDHVQVWLNKTLFGEWSGNRSELASVFDSRYPNDRRSSIWMSGGPQLVFHAIRLRMLDGGTATTLRPVEAVPAKTIDLLPLIDDGPEKVRKENGVLFLRDEPFSNLVAPVAYEPVPAEYDLHLEVERREGQFTFGIGIPYGGHQGMVVIDGWGSKFSGLEVIDGKPGNKNPTSVQGAFLAQGKRVPILVAVRRGSIRLQIGEREIFSWTGRPEQLRLSEAWPDGTDSLFLGAQASEFAVHKFTLTPYLPSPPGGSAGVPSSAPAAATAPFNADEAKQRQ